MILLTKVPKTIGELQKLVHKDSDSDVKLIVCPKENTEALLKLYLPNARFYTGELSPGNTGYAKTYCGEHRVVFERELKSLL